MADGKRQSAGKDSRKPRLEPPPVHRITLTQVSALLPSCLLIAVFFDRESAVSFLAGGVVSVVPQAWFAVRLFGVKQRRSLQEAARTAYVSQILKFLFQALGFALVFALLRPLNAPAVFAGFCIMWALQVVGSARLLRAGY